MTEMEIIEDTEDAVPNPQDLIKSIAEQGYSLESALADLIDNSITAGANKVEILVDTNKQPFTATQILGGLVLAWKRPPFHKLEDLQFFQGIKAKISIMPEHGMLNF